MKPHDAFLELAAAGIDFDLSPAERSRLEHHLAGCPACLRSADALHADARSVAALPVVRLSSRRGDQILASALHPAVVRHSLRLLAVAALLGLLLVGSFVVGSELVRRADSDLVSVPPVPTQTVAPDATTEPSAGPVAPGILAVTRGDETGGTWVELVTLETGAVSPLGLGRDPAWFDDGRLVYACAKQPLDNTTICMVDPTQELQPEIASGASQPAPAPDGSRLVVHRGTIDVGETWILRPDGKDLHRLATGSFLQWSPDGAWLVGQPESATAQVAIVGVDGKGFKVLAPGYDPVWSPSGTQIAYGLVEDGHGSLRTVDVATGQVEILYVAPAAAELTGPAWLPDGGLVFVQDGDLWRRDAGASEPVQLTRGLAIRAGSSGDPLAVSPDGRSIAFTSGSGADVRVGVASVEGGFERLDLGSWPASQPRWAPAAAPTRGPDGSPASPQPGTPSP